MKFLHSILLLFTSILLLCSEANTQPIYWASRVVAFSSQLSTKANSADQIIGIPNAFPQGGKSSVAFQPSGKSNSEYITVAFDKAISAKKIVIAENFNPGLVTKIEAKSSKGDWSVIFFQNVQNLKDKSRVWHLPVNGELEVAEIKLTMDCKTLNKSPQIDAIGLITEQDIYFTPTIKELHDGVFKADPVNLGNQINSEADELIPVISPDGKTLYFVRDKHPENIGKYKKEDIWFSTLNDSISTEFGKAQNIGKPLNNESINAVTSVSPDGNSLMLLNIYKPKGQMDKGVSISQKNEKGWSEPKPVIIEDFYNNNPFNEFYLSSSGNYLLMTLDRKDGFGERDIYISKRNEDNTWGKPLNLGPNLNTAGDEASPFLAADEKTIYFASDGYPGYGSHDLYFSKRKDSTWTSWTEPVNMGKDINTDDFDAYYTVDAFGKYAYFVRENGSNKSDIYRVKIPKLAKPDPVVLVKGKIINVKTQEPIEADVIYQTLPDGKEAGIAKSSPKTGEYQIILPYGKNYSFYAKSEGFISESENIDLTDTTGYRELKKQISLAPIEKGQHIQLNSIFFELGKSELLPASFPELDRVVKMLNENPKLIIEVGGHTDNLGSKEDNLKLSTSRARSVELYFEQHGIDQRRLTYKGYGESQPIVPNNSPENRAKNRRVEFVILEK